MIDHPLPCECGRQPKLVEQFFYGRPSRFKFTLRCPKWFWFRRCKVVATHWIEKDWYDLGKRMVTRMWNRLRCVGGEAGGAS